MTRRRCRSCLEGDTGRGGSHTPPNMSGNVAQATADPRNTLVFQSSRVRGVCVLAVVAIHVAGLSSLSPHTNALTYVLLWVKAMCRFAVPVFVLSAGFYLSLNPRNERPRAFYRRTLHLLLIPYLVYSTLYLLATPPPGGRSVSALVSAIAGGTAYGHLWFIPVILELYVAHPFLRRWYRRSPNPVRFTMVAVLGQWVYATVAVAWLQHSEGWPTDVVRTAGAFVPYVGYFTAGYLLHDRAGGFVAITEDRTHRTLALVTWVAAAAGIAGYAAVPLWLGGSPWAVPGLAHDLLAPVLSASALVVVSGTLRERDSSGFLPRLALLCGLYAFGIYFVHPFVLLAVNWALTNVLHLNWEQPLFYLLAFPAVTGASILAVKALARVPVGRYLA